MVGMAQCACTLFAALFSLATVEARLVTLYPVADAYVEKTRPTWNFRTGILEVHRYLKTEYESFLRFDLSPVSASKSVILGAKLVLQPLYVGDTGVTNNAALVSDNTWSDTGITWNDKPDSGAVVGSWALELGQTRQVEIDVSFPAQQSCTDDKKLSFRLYNPTDISPKASVQYGSSRRESLKPMLELEVRAPTSAEQSFVTEHGPEHGLSTASSGSPAKFTIEARDGSAAPQTNGGDDFRVLCAGPNGVMLNGTVADLLDGTYSVSYTGIYAGEYTCSITFYDQHVKGSPFSVTMLPGPPSAKHSVAYGEGLIETSAGVAGKFALIAKDAYGNTKKLSGAGSEIFYCEVINLGKNASTIATITESVNSTYVVDYLITESGGYLISVKLGTDDIMGSPFRSVVLPGKTDASQTICRGAGLTKAVAGIPAHFAIYARDMYGNERSVCGDNFHVALTGPGRSRVHGLVSENNNGTYLVEFTATISGDYQVHVSLGPEEVVDSPFNLNVLPSSSRATHSVAYGPALVQAVAGERADFQLVAKDTYGNTEIGGESDFSVICKGPGGISISGSVQDNSDGTYAAEYIATIAGKYSVSVLFKDPRYTALQDIFGSPFTTVVTAGESNALHSLVSGPGMVGSIAGLIGRYEVLARDRHDNDRKTGGDDVASSLAGPKGIKLNTTVVDAQDGTYIITYRATIAGEYFITVLMDDEPVGTAFTGKPGESTYRTVIRPGPTSTVKCQVLAEMSAAAMSGSQVMATGVTNLAAVEEQRAVLVGGKAGTTPQFFIIARDSFGNDRTEGGDRFFVFLTRPGVPAVNASVFDNNNGTYTVQYNMYLAGEWSVHVKNGPATLNGSPWRVNIEAAELHPPSCIASGEGLSNSVAGEQARFIIKTKDQYGNDLSTGGGMFSVVLTGPGEITLNGEAMDNLDGTFSATWVAKIAGDYTLKVTSNGQDISGSAFAIKVVPAVTSTNHSLCGGDGLLGSVAGVPGKFVVFAKDRFDNQEVKGGDKFESYMTGPNYYRYNVSTIDDNRDGTYTFWYVLTQAASYLMYVRRDGEDVQGSPFNPVILPANTSSTHCVASGDSLRGPTIAGVKSTINIKAMDVFDNDRKLGGDDFKGVMKSDQAECEVYPVEDNSDGTYNMSYYCETAGSYDFFIKNGPAEILDSPWTTMIIPNKTNADKSVAEDPNKGGTAGVAIRFRIEARDAFRNKRDMGGDKWNITVAGNGFTSSADLTDDLKGTYYAKWMMTKAGAYTIRILLEPEMLPIFGNPFSAVIKPAATATTHCSADGPGLGGTIVGVTASFTILARDEFDNLRDTGKDDPKFVTTLSGPEGTLVKGMITDLMNGSYAVQYVSTVAGWYNMTVKRGNAEIIGSPFRLQIIPGKTSAPLSLSTLDGLSEAIAGVQSTFKIMSRDIYGNRKYVGGDNFTVDVFGPRVEGKKPEQLDKVEVKDDGNGNYTAAYIAKKTGEYKVVVQLDGVPISGSPFITHVYPGPTSAAHCEAFGEGTKEAYVGIEQRMGVLVKDEYDNVKSSGGQTFTGELVGPNERVNATITENADGVYFVSYAAKEKGTYELSVKLDGEVDIYESPFTIKVAYPGGSVRTCPRNCSSHGDCNLLSGQCRCDKGYDGLDCSKKIETELLECPNDCSNHGNCNHFTGKCTCDEGWKGNDCSEQPNKGTGNNTAIKLEQCPNDCSNHGVCNTTTGVCKCDPNWGGADCSHGGMQTLTYLDNERVLHYEPSSGRYKVLHLAHNGGPTRTCTGLLLPAISEGTWTKRNVQFTYLGEGELLEWDNTNGAYSIHHCSTENGDYKEGHPIPCDGVKVAGTWAKLAGVSGLTYLGGNRVMLFDESTGVFGIYRVDRDVMGSASGVLPFSQDAMVEGHWNSTNPRTFTYMENDLMLEYEPTTGAYRFWHYDRAVVDDENPFRGPITAGSFLVTDRTFMSTGSPLMMDYDMMKGDYRVWSCRPSEYRIGEALPCAKIAVGSIHRGPACSPNVSKCEFATRARCVVDPACGWCAESSTCKIGSEDGPVQGSCLSWDYGVDKIQHSMTYLHQSEIMDYSPTSGKYSVWSLDRNMVGRCDALADLKQQNPYPPIAAGSLSVLNHKLVYLSDDQLFDYNPVSGAYRIGKCNRELYRSQGHLHCDTLNQGEWPAIKGDHALVYLGKNLLLDFETPTGVFHIWEYSRDVKEDASPFEDEPRAQGQWDALVGHELIYLDQDLILAYEPLSGHYFFFKLDRAATGSQDPFGAQALAEGSVLARKMQFSYLGNNQLMLSNPLDGKYRIYSCTRGGSVEEDQGLPSTATIFKDSPFPCVMKSDGIVPTEAVCNFTSREGCVKDTKCGWCHQTGQCMMGMREGPCRGACETYEYGESCIGHSGCTACTADSACGYCQNGNNPFCIEGSSLGPSKGTCPTGQWTYETCNVESACGQYSSCEQCANDFTCGWCPSANGGGTCMPGKAESPFFDTCPDWKWHTCDDALLMSQAR